MQLLGSLSETNFSADHGLYPCWSVAFSSFFCDQKMTEASRLAKPFKTLFCFTGWQCKQARDSAGNGPSFDRSWPRYIQIIHFLRRWMVHGRSDIKSYITYNVSLSHVARSMSMHLQLIFNLLNRYPFSSQPLIKSHSVQFLLFLYFKGYTKDYYCSSFIS